MLPLSLVASIFAKLWSMDRRKFFNVFLTWSAMENEESIKTVMKELPVVDILVERGWDRELGFLSQQFTLLGIEFRVHGLLFYSPCVSIFRNEAVHENLEILSDLASEYPMARFAKNLFNIFYQTVETEAAVQDLIEMIMTPYICVDIESMIKTLRRIQYCNRGWDENLIFSFDRVSSLCDGWIRDENKHFKPTWWYPKTHVDLIECRLCKVAYVLFKFCNKHYDDKCNIC